MAIVADLKANAKEELLKALDEAISRNFKAFGREFVNPKTNLASAWTLGSGVDIHVVGQEHPFRIFVARSDVVHRHNRDNEQKDFRFRAGQKLSKLLPTLIILARVYIRENQHKLAVHEANMKAWRKELGSLKIPKAIKVERDPDTGRYSFELNLLHRGCPPAAIKKAVRASKGLLGALQ